MTSGARPGPAVVGVLGGTFDPVHCAHLRLGIELRERLGLDSVRYLLARNPRLRGAPRATPEQRLAMLRAALEGLDGLVPDDRELAREGPTYTLDSLVELGAELPGARLAFILGIDAYDRIEGWHRWEEILARAHLLVVSRPGASLSPGGLASRLLGERALELPGGLAERPAGGVALCEVPPLEISATGVRERVRAGRNIHCLVPAPVRDFIERNGIYTHAK